MFQFIRCCQIMGRDEKEELTAAQIFYPCMQCADIFFLKVGNMHPIKYLRSLHLTPNFAKNPLVLTENLGVVDFA